MAKTLPQHICPVQHVSVVRIPVAFDVPHALAAPAQAGLAARLDVLQHAFISRERRPNNVQHDRAMRLVFSPESVSRQRFHLFWSELWMTEVQRKLSAHLAVGDIRDEPSLLPVALKERGAR